MQPRWIDHAIELIDESEGAHVVLTIVATPQEQAEPDWAHRLFYAFVRADRRLFRRSPDPLTKTSILPRMHAVPIVRLAHANLATEELRSAIAGADLDVLLCLASLELGRQVVTDPRYGVWYFPQLMNDMSTGTARPIGFEATLCGQPVIETSLNQLTAAGSKGRAVYAAVSAINKLSPHYTERRLLWTMATFPARALANMPRCAPGGDQRGDPGAADSAIVPQRPVVPGNVAMLGIAARLGYRQLKHAARIGLYRSEWSVAFRQDPAFGLSTLTRPNPAGTYTLIENPPDRFWADPFPVMAGETNWLFVEEFPHDAGRAHLAVMEIHKDGRVGPSTPVLVRPYHLSYPFVFAWMGEWYMVPETLANKAVDLYRSVRFPFEWTHVKRLLEGVRAVDATLVEIDRRWWMFTTIAPFGGSENDELHIFEASSPLGPWTPHPGNPQTSDVRHSRPAGRIFALDGAWYRPAQDCSRRYGYALTINRITEISETRYAEQEVARIDPVWARDLLGTHTFNHSHGMTFVDADRWRRRWSFGARR
ncbi:MAG: glucosamine inositolphosphorylceramide transferase family protein [Thermomicrobiales bacterium]